MFNSTIRFLLSFSILSSLLLNFACQSMMPKMLREKDFLQMDTANEISDLFRQEFGEKAQVLEIHLKEDAFEIQVQDKNNPKNVDLYQFSAGKFVKVGPVNYSRMENYLNYALFDFDLVNFSAIPRLANEIRKQADFRGGKFREINIKRRFDMSTEFEADRDVIWTMDFDYEGQSVRASADGKERIFDINLAKTGKARRFNLYDEAELKRAEEKIKQSLGDKALILEIEIRDKFLTIYKMPDKVNKAQGYIYDINGLSADNKVFALPTSKEPFPLSEVNFAMAARLSQTALEKFTSPDARVQKILIQKIEVSKGSQRVWKCVIFPTLNKYVLFDADGNLLKVEK